MLQGCCIAILMLPNCGQQPSNPSKPLLLGEGEERVSYDRELICHTPYLGPDAGNPTAPHYAITVGANGGANEYTVKATVYEGGKLQEMTVSGKTLKKATGTLTTTSSQLSLAGDDGTAVATLTYTGESSQPQLFLTGEVEIGMGKGTVKLGERTLNPDCIANDQTDGQAPPVQPDNAIEPQPDDSNGPTKPQPVNTLPPVGPISPQPVEPMNPLPEPRADEDLTVNTFADGVIAF